MCGFTANRLSTHREAGTGRAHYARGMKRLAVWGIAIGTIALVVGLAVGWPHLRSPDGTGVTAFAKETIGTTGITRQPSGGIPEDSPATLHDLETLTGATDPHELIGRHVDFYVSVADINNYTSFWVGSKDNRMLVVLGRDTRSSVQRARDAASANDIQPVAAGQTVHITGTIEGIPQAEARYSWGLSDSQRRALDDQKVYIRAQHVAPDA
jgi:hypothetical protein